MIKLKDIGNRETMRTSIMETYNSICYNDENAFVKENEAAAIEMGIGCYMHNLRNKAISYVINGDLTEEEYIKEMQETLNDVITHQIVLLVNHYRNIIILNDIDEGVNHSFVGANPQRKSENGKVNIGGLVRSADSVSFNTFDIIEKQQKHLKAAYGILKDVYNEIREMIFNQL